MKYTIFTNPKTLFALALCLAMVASLAPQCEAGGITVYKDGEKYVKIGGRIHLQYHYQDPDTGSPDDEDSDEIFFRRLRPYIEGSIHEDWKGKFQIDYGKAEDSNELAIKDAYMQYKGFDFAKITIGNALFPFSQETLTSSKKQQLVERTFVGDHNYGSPDRNPGVHLQGFAAEKKFEWAASFAQADIDPDDDKLDFDTAVNRNSDFNQGWIYGARLSYHPLGYRKLAQGDFKKEMKATINLAAFGWSNDDDNNTRTAPGDIALDPSKPDVDSVTGVEISGAFRGYGISVDAEYNIFDAETVDSTVTSGIYKDGETELKNYAIEGGYMLPNNMFEIVAAYELQDADNYAEEWTRTSIGANWFITKNHDIKLQATYRIGENLKGKKDNDEDEFFLQAQYVF